MKFDAPTCMDEVYSYWKRLWFDDDGVMMDGKTGITILTEWKIIQYRFSKVDDTMKLHIKEKLRKIAYQKTTYLKPPSKPVKTKYALKKSN